ncbi:helix-turn-helix transcriptional regulator [Oceanobacillus sp. J11TS1]|uniref:helix-turn-helix domain-containing protein n=1 Tax=Oceanobacillus sp. J11TS1 TaxID=2807191 RepID=UPI001B212638|nr:helix-turn-helix transcriptional regulator [Oceanobacillus sp. J11TS1]GIO25301.1 hypothetical protein J11TS1_38820 [Oceanobacillus sp. J11TS1]
MDFTEGELLRRMRALAGYTQTQMAKLMNCDKSTISRMEKGLIALTLSNAMRWAHKTNNQDMLIAFIAGGQVMAESIATSGILGFASMLFIKIL